MGEVPLQAYFLNEETGEWEALLTTLVEQGILMGETNHFSLVRPTLHTSEHAWEPLLGEHATVCGRACHKLLD